jgi:tRNA(Ile)-lysidine synthase
MLPLERKFADLVKGLKIGPNTPLAVACSGGPDSMALALIALGWAKANKSKIIALTVDHGLRKESAKEAKQVGAWLKKHRIAHVVLPWKGRKPARNIQEAARKARYRLMTDYCKQHAISHLLVAHHLEDQAETFLLRLARGSGVDGLSAMSALTTMYDVTLARPLLGLSKAEMLDYLSKRKQPYVNDPSNENPAFERVKIRKLLPVLTEVGLSPDRLAKTAATMARARAHLEEETGRFLNSACKILQEGYARLEHVNISEEIALRALATLIMIVGGNDVKTRLNDLERLYAALKDPGFKGATLGGCVFARHKGAILIYRELKAAAKPVAIKPGVPVLWDNRFEITAQLSRGVWRVGALTQKGWLWLSKTQKIKNTFPNKNILYSLPALRDFKGRIFAVPHFKFSTNEIRCEAAFKSPPTLP